MRHPDPNPAHTAPDEIEIDSSSIPHRKPKLSLDFNGRIPQSSPDDENVINTNDENKIETGAVNQIKIKSSFCYDDLESGDDSAGTNPRISIDSKIEPEEVINLNQKKEDNDYNTKTSTIKKIKNFFQRLCCVFFKTPAPIESLAPSIEVSSLGASPPNSIVESSPPNSIVESPRGVSPAPIESPREEYPGASPAQIASSPGEYPGLSPVPGLCLRASSPRNNSPDSLSVFEKIEMFDYLVNAVDINFDKLIDDENKVNCYNELLKEVSNEKADNFKKIYREDGPKNYFKKLIVIKQKINEKQGSGNDKIKIKLFNLINEKLKFDEDTDDKRIDIANFFIKGLILKKNDIINKINKAVGDKSVGR